MLAPKVVAKASNLLNSILLPMMGSSRLLQQLTGPFKQAGKSFNCTSTKSKLKISHAAASVANASWTGPRFSNNKSMYPGYEIGSDLPTLDPTNCTGTVCKSGGEGLVEFAWKAFVKKDMAATLKNATGRDFDAIYRHVKQIFASNLETNEIDLIDFRDAEER
ncbi:glycoside hydrolase [Fusarium mundagurra]|uniref:Glycoside hydrolase n=1 Tax=Fusarium mundagurra TaxID=1567541 RepID=A0A8H5Z2T7_9HYPO|nr:glycoside hydrolase [Fusarium mundagurra]